MSASLLILAWHPDTRAGIADLKLPVNLLNSLVVVGDRVGEPLAEILDPSPAGNGPWIEEYEAGMAVDNEAVRLIVTVTFEVYLDWVFLRAVFPGEDGVANRDFRGHCDESCLIDVAEEDDGPPPGVTMARLPESSLVGVRSQYYQELIITGTCSSLPRQI